MTNTAHSIHTIVLTGGPCAGKTTALVRIKEHFTSLGYAVLTVPEIPTLVTATGWSYLTHNAAFYREGERVIFDLQLAYEQQVQRLAASLQRPTLIVCDRGTMDISAYISDELWADLCALQHTSTAQLREGGRYDAVLHMVTAADGAEAYYTTANNASRYEKADAEGLRQARALDKKIIQAWTGHPHHRIIDNSGDFEHKLERVVCEINTVLGLPQPIREGRKYIVKRTGDLPADSIESHILQTYLTAEPGCEIRLRRRSLDTNTINIHTTRRKISQSEEVVTERQVSDALYESLLQQADPYRRSISKTRHSFIYSGQYFELDAFEGALAGLMILEAKCVTQHEDLHLPPFLEIVRDITGVTSYYNYDLALRHSL